MDGTQKGAFPPASISSLQPEYPMPTADQLYDEAINLQQSGNLEDAVAKLEALSVEQPGYGLAHSGLSAFYSKLGRHAEAVEQAQKVCELEPEDPFSYMAMSLVCQRAGMLAEAEQAMALSMRKQWESRQQA
jgi:Flp pilus assembly protein TadD